MSVDALREAVGARLSAIGVPAFALAVVDGGELVCAEGFGADADTIFPSCSTGKAITATALLRLVERGELDLDRPVGETLPWLAYPAGGAVEAVALRHLVGHTSGLSSDPDVPERLMAGGTDALEKHVREDVPGFRAVAPPGQVFWYSNPGYSIAGLLAQTITGVPFAELVRTEVLEPLGMLDTSFDPSFRSERPAVATERALPIPYPAGGALTTARDLSRLARALLSEGAPLLRPETFSQMRLPHGDAYTAQLRRYGLGLCVDAYRGEPVLSHGGGGMGCGSAFWLLPGRGLAVVGLFNHPGGYAIRPGWVVDLLLGRDAPEPEEPVPADRARWSAYQGAYRSPWPGSGVYPDDFAVRVDGEALVLELGDRTLPLRAVGEPVYLSDDRSTSVGFVPGGDFAMLDAAGIGLVSAWPFRRA